MDYEDIINLPHHVSKRHPQMSMKKRAAQFAPFTALEGYKESIEEAIRENEKLYEPKIDDECPCTSAAFFWNITNSSASDYPITVSKLTIHGGEIIASNTTLLRRSFQQNKVNIIYQQFDARKSTILRSLTVEMTVPELVEELLRVNPDFTLTKPRLYSG